MEHRPGAAGEESRELSTPRVVIRCKGSAPTLRLERGPSPEVFRVREVAMPKCGVQRQRLNVCNFGLGIEEIQDSLTAAFV